MLVFSLITICSGLFFEIFLYRNFPISIQYLLFCVTVNRCNFNITTNICNLNIINVIFRINSMDFIRFNSRFTRFLLLCFLYLTKVNFSPVFMVISVNSFTNIFSINRFKNIIYIQFKNNFTISSTTMRYGRSNRRNEKGITQTTVCPIEIKPLCFCIIGEETN